MGSTGTDAPPATDRLWITEPRRTTSLSTVTRVRGDAFTLDRTLFHPRTRAYAHPQRADRGTAWIEGGDKRKLARVLARDGEVWHRLRGVVPDVGDELQCHLDVPHRTRIARAHTAMHLLLHVLFDGPEPIPLATDPQVKGGGTFRLELDRGWARPDEAKAWLDQANQLVQRDLDVTARHVARDAAEGTHGGVLQQVIADRPSYPGPARSLRVVDVEDAGGFPCDGTHVERTGDVGRIVLPQLEPRDGRVLVIGKVQDG